jgi:hypothetical protein
MRDKIQDYVDGFFSDRSDKVHFLDKFGRRSSVKTAVKCQIDQYAAGFSFTNLTKDEEVRYIADQLCDSLPYETAPTCLADEIQRSLVRKKIRSLRNDFRGNA